MLPCLCNLKKEIISFDVKAYVLVETEMLQCVNWEDMFYSSIQYTVNKLCFLDRKSVV